MDNLQEMMEIPTIHFAEVKTQISEFANNTRGLSIAFFTNSRKGIMRIRESVFRSIDKTKFDITRYNSEQLDILSIVNRTCHKILFYPDDFCFTRWTPLPDYIYLETEIGTGDCFGAIEYRNTFIEQGLYPLVGPGSEIVFFCSRVSLDTTNGPEVNL